MDALPRITDQKMAAGIYTLYKTPVKLGLTLF